jgi:2',3'-cyclic-nucleotide 2'-phosphodiesterase (5'-nucleotidase family)
MLAALSLVLAVQHPAAVSPTDTAHVIVATTDAHGRVLGRGFPASDSILLRVLAITDFHGALESRVWSWSGGRAVGGAAVLKAWLDSLAQGCGCAVVRLDGGDEMQGTPLSNFAFGRPSIAAFNQLGIEAAAIGNHEFDWSLDTLRARIGEARYPFLSANITDTTGRRPDWARPWTVVAKGDAKVAIIGLTTRTTPTTTRPENVSDLRFGDLAQAVRSMLPAARAAADFVIVLAHAGEVCDSGACRGETFDLADALDSGSVDLIVSGHTHQRVDTVVHGIPIVEAGSSGRVIAVVDFVRTAGGGRQVRARLETPWADAVTPDSSIASAVSREERGLDSLTGRIVAAVRSPLRREGNEYPLGRLLADAFRHVGKADIGLVNNGGIRADLAADTVSYGALFEVVPFQNRVVRLTVSGDLVRRVLEHALWHGAPDVHVSGLDVWYDPHASPGQRVRRIRMSNGRRLDPRRRYTLAVADFVADGGDGFDMLVGVPRADIGLVDLDAVIAYLRVLRQPVDAPTDTRFHVEGR